MKIKRTLCILLALALTVSMMILPASAEEAKYPYGELIPEQITIYGLSHWAKDAISIPDEYPQAYGLPTQLLMDDNLVAWSWSYLDYERNVKIDGNTLVPETEGWDHWGDTKIILKVFYKDPDTGTTSSYQYVITVTVKDYAKTYADQLMNDFIADAISSDMSDEEKLAEIAKFIASFDHSPDYSTAASMLILGCGDCYASTDLCISLAEKLGMRGRSRYGNRNTTHKNAVIEATDGTIYEVEAGYLGEAPRQYYVRDRETVFDCIENEDGTVSLWQYCGFLPDSGELIIPADIAGQAVSAISDRFITQYPVPTSIVLPSTVKSIGAGAFYGKTELQSINIPASVTEIGEAAFGGCENLEITCEPNGNFMTIDNVLYSADGTKILFATNSAKDVTIPNTVSTIDAGAFSYNMHIENVTIPASVEKIGKEAFFTCPQLKTVQFLGDAPEVEGTFAFVASHAVMVYDAMASGYTKEYMEQVAMYNPWQSSRYGNAYDLYIPSNYMGRATSVDLCTEGDYRLGEDCKEMYLDVDIPDGCTLTLNVPIADPTFCTVMINETGEAVALEMIAVAPNEFVLKITVTKDATLCIAEQHILPPVEHPDFPDIPEGYWAEKEIDYCVYEAGVLVGRKDGTFDPDAPVLRKTMAMILWRMAGCPETAYDAGFSDVKDDQYAMAVNWAAEIGVIQGYRDGTYRPETELSRQHFAALLWRYSQYTKTQLENTTDNSVGSFPDGATVYGWAVESMDWAIQKGLLFGRRDGNLDPHGTTSRAQMAVILYRYLQAEKK